jgi:hypothetical protein
MSHALLGQQQCLSPKQVGEATSRTFWSKVENSKSTPSSVGMQAASPADEAVIRLTNAWQKN